MTWREIIRLVEIERSSHIQTALLPSIHHVIWDSLGSLILQKTIRCIQTCPIEVLRNNALSLSIDPRKCFSLSRETQPTSTQTAVHELTQLINYRALHSFTLRIQSGVDPIDLAQVATLAGTLKSLCLHLSPESENVCLQTFLPQLTGLTRLELGRLGIDAHLSVLSKLTFLEHVSFVDCQITGEGLTALGGLTVLHTLNFTNCKNLSTAHVAQLAHLTALQNLSFTYGCPLDTGELGKFTALRNLTIYKSKLTDDDLTKLNTLCNLQKLILVPSASSRQISIAGLTQLSGLTALRELHLREITLDEGERLDGLWNPLPALQTLNVTAFRMSRGYDEYNHPKHGCRISHETYTRPQTT